MKNGNILTVELRILKVIEKNDKTNGIKNNSNLPLHQLLQGDFL